MTDYKDLAVRYLRANRGRSIITIIGVVITVMVLYGGLNLAYSYLLHERDAERKERDYEFVVMAENRTQAEQIAADELIEKAYTGRYEYTDWSTDTPVRRLYKNAVYATSTNPYRMEKIMNEIADKYSVPVELNDYLALLYFQDGATEGSMLMVLVWLILLVAYIFAIFAVGIIRNTIQMFMMEQIKDYGILRCIGATKGQLKKIVYLMGAVLELVGIVIGVILGGFVSMIIGAFVRVNAGYHLIAVLPVLVCYLGDLYFVMRDNCKVIVGMSPISAVRGQFRIKQVRLKNREKGLMGRIFGVEGEYARKSVLRNHGRFVKTVASLSISIAALVAVMSMSGAMDSAISFMDSKYGSYQLHVYRTPSPLRDIDSVEAGLPNQESLKRIADIRSTISARKVYETTAYASDIRALYSKYTKDYIDRSTYGGMLESMKKIYDGGTPTSESKVLLSMFRFRGLSVDELTDLQQYLVDGTVKVSDHGILVVTGGSTVRDNELFGGDVTYETLKHLWTNEYRVGDTIDIVDTKLLFSETKKAIEAAEAAKAVGDKRAPNDEDEDHLDTGKQLDIAAEVYERLVAEGHYKTYTVEGTLDLGDKVTGEEGLQVYTTLDNYLAETGYSEGQISGMEYQIDSKRISRGEILDIESAVFTDTGEDFGDYMYLIRIIQSYKTYNRVILMIAALVFALGAVNIINATAGNLHMRRKEFAQLRVIGMSRKRLIKTVMMEGIMAVLWSDVIGIVIGTAVYYGEYSFIRYSVSMRFAPSATAIVIGVILSAVLVFGSIYVPLRRLPQSMAEDLTLEE